MVSSTAAIELPSESPDGFRRRPIDLVHLARQSFGDPGLEEEILRIFAERLVIYYGRIETSTTIDELLAHLHALRSASGGVGAWSVADLAGLVEDELRSGVPVNPERIDDLGMAVQETSRFIEELLAERPDC